MQEKLKAAGYVRVSTARDCQDGSFEAQAAYLRAFLERQPGVRLVGIYGDQGKSGRCMRNRPELQRMIGDAEAGRVQAIYCKSLSRFARNMRECLATVRYLGGLGVDFIFIKEGIDTRLMEGELLLSIMAAIAAAESDSIAENIRLAREKALLSGKIWHRPPYGYAWDEAKNWKPVPREALRIQSLFAMAAQGHAYSDIRRVLVEMETAENTGRVWTQDKILAALRNEAYVGDYLSHKKLLVTRSTGAKRRVANDGRWEQIHLEGHHPAIVTREIFRRANELQRGGVLRRGRAMAQENRRQQL